MPAAGPLPWDWRDGAHYAPLLHLERSGFAWEWLRRDPEYRAEALRSPVEPSARSILDREERDPRAAKWGLARFEPPGRPAPGARPIWLRKALPRVLPVSTARGGAVCERFDLERFAALARLVPGPRGSERLLLSNGFQSLRVDVLAGSLASGPVRLRYHIAGLAAAEPSLLVLRQFLALCRDGRISPSLHPADSRAPRWIKLLRVQDALAAGADQRAMAEVILDGEAALPRWRVEVPSLRSQIQRMVRQARQFAGGGYRTLLTGAPLS